MIVHSVEEDKIAECYSGVMGYKLRKVLNNEFFKTLRTQFWLELKGGIEHLETFYQENTNAFFSLTNYAYILGKFESIDLPNSDSTTLEVPMMFVSELYTCPSYRGQKIANSFIRDAQFEAKKQNVPLVCGCPRDLKTFYEHMGFVPIEPSQSSECLLMLWASHFGYLITGFKNLFEKV